MKARLFAVCVIVVLAAGQSDEACRPAPPPENRAPAVSLRADPGEGPPPLLAMVDAGASDPDGDVLTYTWTLEGAPLAEAYDRFAWTFSEAGSYELSVAVSDGEHTVSDTLTVAVGPVPSETMTAGSAGGEVSLGDCALVVPEGVAPEACTFTLKQLPSMAGKVAKSLDPALFAPVGQAYGVETPLKSNLPMQLRLSWTAADVPEGFSDTHMAVMQRLPSLPEVAEGEAPPERLPYMDYAVFPVSRPEAGVAVLDLYARGDFQLVAMAEALDTATLPVSKWRVSGAGKAAPVPDITVVFEKQPGNRAAYLNALDAGIRQAHQVYVAQKGFPAPTGHLRIVVKDLGSGTLGSVAFNTCNTITMHHEIPSTDSIKKTVAHEYFHNIQMFASNHASLSAYWWPEDWFMEGTASWAMDEAYDAIVDEYHATPWKRLREPLNKLPGKSLASYETVGFWKWAEAKMPGILSQTLAYHQLQTHASTGAALIENSATVKFSDSFHGLWPNLNYLAFVADALFYKDFEPEESNLGELWDNDYLGAPRYVNAEASDWTVLRPDNPGDGKDNPLEMEFSVKKHLSSDTRLFHAKDLAGILHVKFPKMTESLRATVIAHDFAEVKAVQSNMDLASNGQEFTAEFEAGLEAVVFIGDPRWQYDSAHTPVTGKFEVWVESPCGAVPGSVTKVTNTAELVSAVGSVSAGNTIQLAAGSYSPAIQEWPRLWNAPANLGLDGQTLVGAGKSATTIRLTGANGGIVAHGSVSLRNLTVQVLNSDYGIAIIGMAIDDLELCNADILVSAARYDGISFQPWEEAGTHSFTMINSTLQGHGPSTSGPNYFGFMPTSFYAGDVINILVSNSMISGWDYALTYSNGCDDAGIMNATYDCDSFSNNTFNVHSSTCHTSDGLCYCDGTEMCPKP